MGMYKYQSLFWSQKKKKEKGRCSIKLYNTLNENEGGDDNDIKDIIIHKAEARGSRNWVKTPVGPVL